MKDMRMAGEFFGQDEQDERDGGGKEAGPNYQIFQIKKIYMIFDQGIQRGK